MGRQRYTVIHEATIWDLLTHLVFDWACLADTGKVLAKTETFSGRDADFAIKQIFAPKDNQLPPIAASRCAVQRRPLKATHPIAYEEIEGCTFSIHAGSFPMVLESVVARPVRHKPAMSPNASTLLPPIKVSFAIAEVYYVSPPETWRRNEPLIYVDRSQTPFSSIDMC